MPALPSPGKVCRIDLQHTWGLDTNARIRFFVQYAGTVSTGDANGWASTIQTASWTVASSLQSITHTTCTLQVVTVNDLSSATGAVGISNTAQSGTDAGPVLAADAAVVIRFKVARKYRGGHPKVFLPGGTTDDLTNPQQWLDASVTEFTNAWNTFMSHLLSHAPVAVNATNQCNVSFFAGNTVFITPSGRAKNIAKQRLVPIVDPITQSAADKNVGTIRRRTLIRP